MNNYYVLKLFNNDGIYMPDVAVYKDVEIRSPRSDNKYEKDAILKSVEYSKSNLKYDLNCRIGTIIKCDLIEKAEDLADEKFVEVLDLISINYPLSSLEISRIGYIKNLDNGNITPIQLKTFGPSMMFLTRRYITENYDFDHWLINQNFELSNRYKKSIHWSRKAKIEKNIHSKILFHWFSIEALFKENESDDVTGLILLFLGFPGSTYSKYISRTLINKLEDNNIYKKWKFKIKIMINEIRKFRNNSVHSGFRNIDFPINDIRFFNQIMIFACSRCQGGVISALLNDIKTIQEFKDYSGIIFENRANLIDDIFGNIIHTFENDYMKCNEGTYI